MSAMVLKTVLTPDLLAQLRLLLTPDLVTLPIDMVMARGRWFMVGSWCSSGSVCLHAASMHR